MSQRCANNGVTWGVGGFVAAFAFIVVATLIAFYLAKAGLFDPKPMARAGSPPRGDVVVLSNGEFKLRLKSQPFRVAQSSADRYGGDWRQSGRQIPENHLPPHL